MMPPRKATETSSKIHYCQETKPRIVHDGDCEKFSEQVVLDVKHKTAERSYPTKFYIFKNATSPPILMSYAAKGYAFSSLTYIEKMLQHNYTPSKHSQSQENMSPSVQQTPLSPFLGPY